MVTWEKDSDSADSTADSGGCYDHNEIARMTPETNKAESLYGGSTVGSVTGHSGEDSNEIGGRETAQVTRLRFITLLVLFLAAGAVCATVYLVTSGAQQDDFETKFEGVAGKVLETFEEIVSEKLAALSAFSVSTTAYARSHNQEFPFVTMNDFQQRAGSIREVVDCLMVYTIFRVVQEERDIWERYTLNNNQWYYEDLAYQEEKGLNIDSYPFMPFIFHYNESGLPAYEEAPGPYAAIWQSSPLFPFLPNFNVATYAPYAPAVASAIDTGNMAIGGIITAPPASQNTSDISTAWYSILLSAKEGKDVPYNGDPMSYVALPIFDNFDVETRQSVGTVSAIMHWATYFKGVVPPGSKPITIVLENACDGPYTYQADNNNVHFLGKGDLHERAYDHLEEVAPLNDLLGDSVNQERVYNSFELSELGCPYSIHVYPTTGMEEDSETNIPLITTSAVAVVFVFTALVFLMYNRIVENRQRVVLSQATESADLVSTFLPAEVQKRLLKDDATRHVSSVSRLKSFLSEGGDTQGKPIADLFPHCTVLFADICGFTAWSSTREPEQVFVLLQTVYQSFDVLAKKHKVFKIETIGDTYVAVTGLPNDQPMHAILMARFAWDCLLKMNSLVKELERTLGPDTGDLGMRFGLHSGPVTAGVLRGDRPRFQLFGDTVNTASRMESTGVRSRIQVSHTTAAEIQKLGKGRWLTKRDGAVVARGKGMMETYWLVPTSTSGSTDFSGSTINKSDPRRNSTGEIPMTLDTFALEKHNRLVDWCVKVLQDKLCQIQALRQGLFRAPISSSDDLICKIETGRTYLDEVQEVMTLPPYDPKAAEVLARVKHENIELDPAVVSQLAEYVSSIAQAYRPNSFHSFEHACHVTMATEKFLKRIISPNMDGDIKTLHEYTHGLTSDPLLLMAIILSAVIHDVDHRGISNMQLAQEDENMATTFKNKSIAEQNSLDIAWDLLMGPNFGALRQAMFVDRSDVCRFRQMLCNIVLATDIFDKELNDLRKSRWNKAFSEHASGSKDNNLRATIVIEHIIQASDVSHTMQHWHIYRKWNERLFLEMSRAYRDGRMGKDPAEFWYQGELGFFDNYIIPLAKKLKDCNVFGVSSDECLNYAMQNRLEWEQRGKHVVEELIQTASRKLSKEQPRSLSVNMTGKVDK